MSEIPDVFTTLQAAKLLGVSITSVQNMTISGEIEFWRTPGGHRRISRLTIEDLLRKRQRYPEAAEALLGITVPHEVVDSTSKITPVQVVQSEVAIKILFAEDDPIQVAFFRSIVSRYHHPIELTVVGDASFAFVQLERMRPDLVVTDLMMEPFKGYSLIKVLGVDPAYSFIDVMAISAMTKDEAQAKGSIPEWVTFIQKPLSSERMFGYLDAIHARVARKNIYT